MSLPITMQVGTHSELIIMSEYVKRGYSVFLPFANERCDFIAEKNGRFVRVQVKTGTPFNEGRELVAFSQKAYTIDEADVVAVYDPNTTDIYYVPVGHVVGMTAIRLRLEPYLYNVKTEKALDVKNYKKFLG